MCSHGDAYEFQSDFFKRYIAEEGARERARGYAEGCEQGLEQGREQGLEQGRAEALLLMLEARSLPISDDARARILACTDTAQLDAWVRKGVSVAAVDELF